VRRRFIGALNLPDNPDKLVTKGLHVCDSMEASTWFPSPTPPLADVRAALTLLREAVVTATSRAVGTVEARGAEVTRVVSLLHQLKAGVQKVCDDNPDSAAVIASSAGMDLKSFPGRQPNTWKVEQGPLSGTAVLTAVVAAPHAYYEWQISLDKLTWTSLPITTKATTTVEGLTPGTTYYFRYRTVTPKGTSNWSDPREILVK
jgi:hypothetical protein